MKIVIPLAMICLSLFIVYFNLFDEINLNENIAKRNYYGETFFIYSIVLIINWLFSFLISYFLGRKRRIGSYWSYWISFWTSPILGLVFSLNSKPKGIPYDKNGSFLRLIISILLFILACSRTYYLLDDPISFDENRPFNPVVPHGIIGGFLLAIYLFESSSIIKVIKT